MQSFFTIVLAILAFGVLIIVHEFGHFITAKRSGIQVNEFWIGMGPILFSREWKGTVYCLRLLPIGGACVMEGEDSDSGSPNSFGKAKISRRILVVVAGALMNFLLGFLLVILLFMTPHYQAFVTTTIDHFREGFSYEGEAMLMPGDELLKIDGYRVFMRSDIDTGLQRGASDGKFDIVVRRNGDKVSLKDIPLTAKFEAENGRKEFGIYFKAEDKTVVSLLKNAFYTSVNFARLVWDSFAMLVSGQVGVDQLAGPIGVTGVMAETVKTGFHNFVLLISFISINLGVMNLLPLPALDGGRLVFLAIEAVRGKPIPPKYEGWIHAAGLALLMALMVYVTGQDILRLIADI